MSAPKLNVSLLSATLVIAFLSACASPPTLAPATPTSAPAATSAPAVTATPATPAAPAATDSPTAAATTATTTVTTTTPTVVPTSTPRPTAVVGAGESLVTTWYYYDQNNTDDKANERIGNAYIAKTIPLFNEAHKGKFVWDNTPRDYTLVLDLVTAVQNGGDVPDVMQFDITNLPTYLLNNTIADVEWAKGEAWFKDLDPKAVQSCTVDGKLYCIPISESPWLTYYWTDLFKNGFPKTPADLLTAGDALNKDGKKALTYWGNTAFDGEAAGRYFYQTIASFGGSYDDGAGKMKLNTPENIKAVAFMREVVKKELTSESVFAGNFEEEEAFKQGTAGAFPTGFFIAVRYLNPLKSPGGKDYKDIEAAVNDKAIGLAPFVADAGKKPGCGLDLFGFVMPRTAKNAEGAKAYINWVMDSKNTVDWIVNAGGGFPTGSALRADATFTTETYKQAQAVAAASDCKPWFGSLRHVPEAKKIIANVIYDLIKAKPDADIAAELTKADDEYNKGN